MNVVETRGLAKSYRGKRAVDRFDMHVAQGDIYGFVGKNGAGKSTVMKMVCGLATPTEGEIELFGERAGAGSHAGPGRRSGGEGAPRIGALIEAPGIGMSESYFKVETPRDIPQGTLCELSLTALDSSCMMKACKKK